MKIESFVEVDEFKSEVRKLIDWVKSSPKMPGVETIYVPGEIETETRRKRESEGVYLEDARRGRRSGPSPKNWAYRCRTREFRTEIDIGDRI